MDYFDMEQKMAPMHKEQLRVMLGVNQVPEPVMRRYFLIKKYTDKISAPLRVMDLLQMAIACGFDLETGRFDADTCGVGVKPDEEIEEVLVEESEQIDIDEAVSSPAIEEPTQETIDDIVEEVNPADEIVNEVPEPKKDDGPIEDGERVQVLLDGDIKDGIVRGHEIGETEITYKVEVDGETHELSEDDVDA